MAEVDPGIAEALDKMAAEDPQRARMAATAMSWVTGGGGAGRITQERIQRFCWYDLPLKWQSDVATRQTIVVALAELLDHLGLPRYAEICRSPQTIEVHAAYAQNPQKGLLAFRKANLESGIYPPDLPEFTWGAAMGPEEAATLAAVQDYLELALVAGDLVPGTRGWKRRQAKLVRTYLNTPNPRLAGQTPLDVTLTERIQRWLGAEQSETRRQILSGLANRLLHSAHLPEEIKDPYPALSRFLSELKDGEGPDPDRPDPLVALSKDLRFTRKHSGRIVLTRLGESYLKDPLKHWRRVPQTLKTSNSFHRLAGELLLATLLKEGAGTLLDIVETISQAAAEAGYREAGTGEPPGTDSINRACSETLGPFETLELIERSGESDSVELRLNPIGEATALETLRQKASGPGVAPWE
ncbi:MAG: hypothetical protein WD602_00640 [Actinomycetota bacterium]